MNIMGLSQERLKALIDRGFVKDFADIYHLDAHREALMEMERFGQDSVDNLLAAIEDSRSCRLSNVLTAIGIPNIGKNNAKLLAARCFGGGNPLERFLELARENFDWTELDGFGEVMSAGINQFVAENEGRIRPLVPILRIAPEAAPAPREGGLGGRTFCITGKLLHFQNRDALVAKIEEQGGRVVTGVSAKTDYLITNDKDSGSSKNQKAAKFGTRIISEEEFMALCGG